jgi:hypothetical protein
MRLARLLRARGTWLASRSAMPDAALSECRPAALENPAPSMKAAAGKTRGGEPANVGPSRTAKPMEAAPSMKAARKTWGGRRADMDACGPAKPMEAAAMETSDARKTWGGRRADVDSCGPAKPMAAADAGKTWGRRRADVGNSDAVKVMKIAAAKGSVESAVGKTGGDGRGARAEIRRSGNAAGAKAMQTSGAAESMKRRSAAGA